MSRRDARRGRHGWRPPPAGSRLPQTDERPGDGLVPGGERATERGSVGASAGIGQAGAGASSPSAGGSSSDENRGSWFSSTRRRRGGGGSWLLAAERLAEAVRSGRSWSNRPASLTIVSRIFDSS